MLRVSDLSIPLFSNSTDPLKSLPRNRNGIDVESDVYKMLQDYERPASEPKQSGSFRYLQGMLEAGENGRRFADSIVLSVPKTPPFCPSVPPFMAMRPPGCYCWLSCVPFPSELRVLGAAKGPGRSWGHFCMLTSWAAPAAQLCIAHSSARAVLVLRICREHLHGSCVPEIVGTNVMVESSSVGSL